LSAKFSCETAPHNKRPTAQKPNQRAKRGEKKLIPILGGSGNGGSCGGPGRKYLSPPFLEGEDFVYLAAVSPVKG